MKLLLYVSTPVIILCSGLFGYGLGVEDSQKNAPVVIPIIIEQSPTPFISHEQFKQLSVEQQCADGGPSAAQIVQWVDEDTRENDYADVSIKKQLANRYIKYYDETCRIQYKLNSNKDLSITGE